MMELSKFDYTIIKYVVTKHLDFCTDTYGADRIIGIFPYGSMNYGLFDAQSDVDTYCLLAPSDNDILSMRQESATYEIDGGHCVVKDVRLWAKELRKGSPNALELLVTCFGYIGNRYKRAWNNLTAATEYIAHMNKVGFIKACVGMVMNGCYSIPYEADDVEDSTYRISGKMYVGRCRVTQMAFKYLQGRNLKDCYRVTNKWLVNIKRKVMDIPKKFEDSREKRLMAFGDMAEDDAILGDRQNRDIAEQSIDNFLKTVIFSSRNY